MTRIISLIGNALTTLAACCLLLAAPAAAQVPGGYPGARFSGPTELLNDILAGSSTGTGAFVLQVSPTIQTPNFTAGWSVDGIQNGGISTNYTFLNEASGNIALQLGNATDPRNYYSNDNHRFRNKALTANFVDITSTGLSIYGSTSGTIRLAVPAISGSNVMTFQAATDTVVGRATTDTLTNKTLTSPVISTISNTGTLTLPTSTDTLVGRTTTDTLTNKTLDAATLATRLVKGIYIIDANAVQVCHTGDTVETTLKTISVPANSMGANGVLRITAQWGATGAAGTKTGRTKFAGTTFMGLAMSATNLTMRTQAQLANRNATNSQIGSSIAQANWSNSSGSLVTTAIDTTSSQDITLTMQLGDAGDTGCIESYTVELIVP